MPESRVALVTGDDRRENIVRAMELVREELLPRLIESVRVMNRNIVRLSRRLLPHVAIIDGFEAMEGEGPGGGDPVALRTAIASADPVAADAVAAKVMGFEPLEVGYLFYADECGMGVGDLSRIEIVGSSIEQVARSFKPHPEYETQKQWRV